MIYEAEEKRLLKAWLKVKEACVLFVERYGTTKEAKFARECLFKDYKSLFNDIVTYGQIR